MNLLEIIKNLEREREENHRVPTSPTFLELKNRVSEEMNKEFSLLLKNGDIEVFDNINGKSVKTKKNYD